MFSILAASVYLPINSAQVFSFLYIFKTTFTCCLFIFLIIPILTGVRWFSLQFWFAFSWLLMVLCIFSYNCWWFEGLLWKYVYSDPWPIFYKTVWGFAIELYQLFIHFNYWSFTEYTVYKYLLLFFFFLFFFFFFFFTFAIRSKKPSPRPRSRSYPLYFFRGVIWSWFLYLSL